MTQSSQPTYLTELEQQRSEIKTKIKELQNELMIVEKLIIREKTFVHGRHSDEKVTKKNANRIYVESKILEILLQNKGGLTPARLGQLLGGQGLKVNPATLRSTLTRMLARDRVAKSGGNYKHPDFS